MKIATIIALAFVGQVVPFCQLANVITRTDHRCLPTLSRVPGEVCKISASLHSKTKQASSNAVGEENLLGGVN